ncbi:MAG: SanA/YdcF family protein [Actinophytocola sp.]|uniref:SanA/YdcF family protein n=1 Tax=Actinophytocola sp. TaxID=1872138 RepID=UPI003D6A5594
MRRVRQLFGRRWVKISLGALLALVLLFGAGPYLWIRFATSGKVHAVADAPAAPVGIVLGAGLKTDGSPKPYLRTRLDDTLRLYQDGKIRAILVSGDHGQVEYDEVAAMARWLVDRGVPVGKVVADHAGFDTYDSCVRAYKIFGVRKALVVTQEFHVRRAVFLCREAGIDAAGVGSPAPDDDTRYQVREVPAAIKATLDVVVDASPTYLGKYETGVDEALSAP